MPNTELQNWFASRIPEGWLTGPPLVSADNDEILVVITLPPAEGSCEDRVQRFREESREQRIALAAQAEGHFRRKVAWGATCDGQTSYFTTLSLPVMTRLRMQERVVLDTLVDAGVARSRSEALAWCVRLVGTHQKEWIAELQEALVKVGEVRRRGPG